MKFEYTAQDVQTGEVVKEVKEAESEKVLLGILRKQGFLPIRISEASKTKRNVKAKFFQKRSNVTSKDLVFFTQQLAAWPRK